MAKVGSLGARLYTSTTPLETIELNSITDISFLTINTEVGRVEDFEEFGRGHETVNYQPVPETRTYKIKGNFNDGGLRLILGHDLSDTGQFDLYSFANENNQNTYPFKIVLSNLDAIYFGAKVLDFKSIINNVNNVFRSSVDLEINTEIFTGINNTFTFNPGHKDLTFSCFAPTLSRTLSSLISPTRENLVFSKFAPTIFMGVDVSPPRKNLVFSSFAPTISRLTSVVLNPPRKDLVLSKFPPTVTRTTINSFEISPARKDLVFTTFVPVDTKSNNARMSPWWGNLRFSEQKPTVTRSTTEIISPARRDLVISKSAPNVGKGTSRIPPRRDLAFSKFVPTRVVSLNTKISIVHRNLTINGFSPRVLMPEGSRIVVSWARANVNILEDDVAFVSYARVIAGV